MALDSNQALSQFLLQNKVNQQPINTSLAANSAIPTAPRAAVTGANTSSAFSIPGLDDMLGGLGGMFSSDSGVKTYSIGDLNPATNQPYSPLEINSLNEGALNAAKASDIGQMGFGDYATLGLSAFDAYNRYGANKMNKKAINAEIDNLKQNQERRTGFENDTKAAFNSAFSK